MLNVFRKVCPTFGFHLPASTHLIARCHNTMNIFPKRPVPQPEDLPKYEKVEVDEKVWDYIDGLMPLSRVPDVPVMDHYPSNYKPQKLHPDIPYFVQRSRNHMLPVYLKIRYRGISRHTWVRHVHGDIYKLAYDLLDFLQKVEGHKLQTVKVLETSGNIVFFGDHVEDIKLWLEHRGM